MLPLIFLAPITIAALLNTSAGEPIVDRIFSLFHNRKPEDFGSCSAPPATPQKVQDLSVYQFERPIAQFSSQQKLLDYCLISKNSIFSNSSGRSSFPGSISSKCEQESQNFNNASFYSEVGQLWKQENRSDMSLLAYCRAVDLSPTSANYFALGSIALDGQNNALAAIIALEEALKFSNASEDVSLSNQIRMSLGRAYYQNFLDDPQANHGSPHFISQYTAEKMSKNLLKSLEYFNQVSGASSFKLSYSKGIVKNELGKVALAARTSDSEKKEFSEATILAKKYFDEAIVFFRESIPFYENQHSTFLDPNYQIAEVLRSKIKMEMDDLKGEQLVERWKEVVHYYTKAFGKSDSVFKNDSASLFRLATALELSGDLRGIKFCEKALDVAKAETTQNNERISNISLILAYMYLDHSKKGESIDFSKVVKLFEVALSGKKVNEYPQEFRAYAVLIKQSNPVKAFEIFEGLLGIIKESFDEPMEEIEKEELYHYADLFFNQNEKTLFAAADLSNKLSFLDPFLRKGEIQNDPRTHYFIGRCEELRKNDGAAIAAYQKSAELDQTNSPQKADSLLRIGKIHLRSDKSDSFAQAISFHSQSINLYKSLLVAAKADATKYTELKKTLLLVLTSLADGYVGKAKSVNDKKDAKSAEFDLALTYLRKATALYEEAKNPSKNQKVKEDADLGEAVASIHSKIVEVSKLRGAINKKKPAEEESDEEDNDETPAEVTSSNVTTEDTPTQVE